MILQNSIGHDDKIKALLLKGTLNMSANQIDAWMKYQYDPKHMFCLWEDDQITAVYKYTKEVWHLKENKCVFLY